MDRFRLQDSFASETSRVGSQVRFLAAGPRNSEVDGFQPADGPSLTLMIRFNRSQRQVYNDDIDGRYIEPVPESAIFGSGSTACSFKQLNAIRYFRKLPVTPYNRRIPLAGPDF